MTKLKALLAKKDSNKGFTLMEMIIVIAIIAILIALIAPNLISYLNTANETKVKANAKVCYTSANAWVAQMKVAGEAVGKGEITYTGGTETPTKKDGTITVKSTAKLDNSIGAKNWPTTESVVLEFKDGVCVKATYTAADVEDPGVYPTN